MLLLNKENSKYLNESYLVTFCVFNSCHFQGYAKSTEIGLLLFSVAFAGTSKYGVEGSSI